MKLVQPRRFHPWKTLWVLSVLLVFFIYLTLRDTPGPSAPSWGGQTMGTLYNIRLADSPLSTKELESLKAAVESCLVEVNRQMSHYQPDSEISEFNRSTSAAPFRVSAAFARVARFSLELCERSGGLFDPTLGPLINLWGFGPEARIEREPTKAEVDAARDITGCGRLQVTANDELVKDIPELMLNLSAVAKGFGVDEAARVIRERGVSNVFVEIGGEVMTFGHNAKGGKWRIGVDAPRDNVLPGELIEAVLELSGLAVATSGDYRNYFEDESGKRFSHILNPHTGRPIEHHLASVTVVAPDCLTADGLATTLFVMGAEEGRKFIETWDGAEALFIVRNPDGSFSETASSGFESLTGYRAVQR